MNEATIAEGERIYSSFNQYDVGSKSEFLVFCREHMPELLRLARKESEQREKLEALREIALNTPLNDNADRVYRITGILMSDEWPLKNPKRWLEPKSIRDAKND